MKNLILITLLFVVFRGEAQTTKPIDGFLGIKFGSSAAQVTEALKAKGAGLFPGPTAESIAFGNISLANRKIATLFVHFVKDQAYEAVFVFKPDQEAKTIEYYNALVKDISDVYGLGKVSKKFKQPYSDGDGYEITAIKTGNADYLTNWEDGANYMTVKIEPNATGELRVRLYYNDGKLVKIYNEQQKAKNKSEF
jgi:hypothetical protein